jgi:hypothetical protein
MYELFAVLKISAFWDVAPYNLVVINVSQEPAAPIFMVNVNQYVSSTRCSS